MDFVFTAQLDQTNPVADVNSVNVCPPNLHASVFLSSAYICALTSDVSKILAWGYSSWLVGACILYCLAAVKHAYAL